MPAVKKQSKKTPPAPPVGTHDRVVHEALSDTMVHNERHESARALDAKHTLEQGSRIRKTLDQTLEHASRVHDTLKKTKDSVEKGTKDIKDHLDEVSDKIIAGTKPPEIQKVQLHTPDDEVAPDDDMDDQDKANAMLKGVVMLRGKRGPKGEKHTDEEIMAMLTPMVPKLLEAFRPTPESLIDLIKPLIPEVQDGDDGEDGDEGQPGKDGEDGEEPTDDRLLELIGPIVKKMAPKQTNVDAAAIKAYMETVKMPTFPSLDEIIGYVKKNLKYNDIKDKPNLDTFLGARKGLGGTGYLREISDVEIPTKGPNIGDALVWNGKLWVSQPISSGPSGYGAPVIPTGAIDGTNAEFTLPTVPTAPAAMLVNLNGAIQSQLFGDYTVSGAIITFASAPSVGSALEVLYY